MESPTLDNNPEENQSVTEQSQASNPSSKKAQKRAARQARFTEQKLERRAKEKQAKKERKRIKAQKRDAGELEDHEAEAEEEKRRMMKRAKTGDGQKPFGATICVDLGFDDMMTDKVGNLHDSRRSKTNNAQRTFEGDCIFDFTTCVYV